eukprot:335060_1
MSEDQQMLRFAEGVSKSAEIDAILNSEALSFLFDLCSKFQPRIRKLLDDRKSIAKSINDGKLPTFDPDSESIRKAEWRVCTPPAPLKCRHADVMMPLTRTGSWQPDSKKDGGVSANDGGSTRQADSKSPEPEGEPDGKNSGTDQGSWLEQCLNSGADGIQADLDDAHCPSWNNNVEAQVILRDIVHGKFKTKGKDLPALLVRPRSLNLFEANLLFGEDFVSGALFDFGIFMFHNAKKMLEIGFGPYFYIPKLENANEAKLWRDVFQFSENRLKIPQNSIKCVVLIENILAA